MPRKENNSAIKKNETLRDMSYNPQKKLEETKCQMCKDVSLAEENLYEYSFIYKTYPMSIDLCNRCLVKFLNDTRLSENIQIDIKIRPRIKGHIKIKTQNL